MVIVLVGIILFLLWLFVYLPYEEQRERERIESERERRLEEITYKIKHKIPFEPLYDSNVTGESQYLLDEISDYQSDSDESAEVPVDTAILPEGVDKDAYELLVSLGLDPADAIAALIKPKNNLKNE